MDPNPTPTPDPSAPPATRQWRPVVWIGLPLVIAVVAFVTWPTAEVPGPPSQPDLPPPLPPVATTPFTNTNSTGWVGAAACAECHPRIAEHHQASSHASALADVSLEDEPPDAEFDHATSGRHYRVYRDKDQLRHRESITLEDGEDLVLADHPVSMVVGTGHQGRTYLVDLEGFLFQSPITWYASNKRWRLAPGYTDAAHPSFERPIPVDCLICHAGRSESVNGAFHRVRFHERTIGCERCHGAGAEHVTTQKALAKDGGGPVADPVASPGDTSIVHPGSLSRERLESICGQCHLSNGSAASLRGRRLEDFRPGQRLAEYRAHYVLDGGGSNMTVVGHIEQLQKSRCYTQTTTLTCTTCHDPHRHLPKSEAAAVYRAKCLECHQPNACGLPVDGTARQAVADRCVDCHMPGTKTEIPHVASTHHRIGIHSTTADRDRPTRLSLSPGTLKPLYDLSHLPPLDQDRCRGLAYRQLASKQKDPRLGSTFRLRARRILQTTYDAGLQDPQLLSALADLSQGTNPSVAGQLARQALESDAELTALDRANSLGILGNSLIAAGKLDEAIPVLQRLVTIHHNPVAWLQLSQCQMSTGDTPGAIAAAEQAVKIGAHRAEVHDLLARLYQQAGQAPKARRHRLIAESLTRARQGGRSR